VQKGEPAGSASGPSLDSDIVPLLARDKNVRSRYPDTRAFVKRGGTYVVIGRNGARHQLSHHSAAFGQRDTRAHTCGTETPNLGRPRSLLGVTAFGMHQNQKKTAQCMSVA